MIILLSLTSQVGGIIWFVVFFTWLVVRYKTPFVLKLVSFLGIYLLAVMTIVPSLARKFGKVPMPSSMSGNLVPHNALYPILNRNYVTPQTLKILLKTADEVAIANPELKMVYLDASFPFSKEMPLPPHISHSNGRKVDLCFAYKKNGKLTNKGSSILGYGHFVEPKDGEYNQVEQCLANGHTLYDASKYAGFGKRRDYEFDPYHTRLIIEKLLENKETNRIYIEEHLKQRMGIVSEKVRSTGCWAVRHDDHIHFQI